MDIPPFKNDSVTPGRRRRARVKQATPPWSDSKEINAIYRECRRRRARGEDVVVDHDIPLAHKYVCGLHVATNLKIISSCDNHRKGNHSCPEMEKDQHGFGFMSEPYQLNLGV
jgi:hypothetical protein